MYYYINSVEGTSWPFLMMSPTFGQMIRDTHFSFIDKQGEIKLFKLIKTAKKYSPEYISQNTHLFEYTPFTYSTGNSRVQFDNYTIDFCAQRMENDKYYIYCPTLTISTSD